MKKIYPTISIAIPTFNEQDVILKCLESIFSQDYEGVLEVFIVDGGSTDKTLEQARKFPVKILNNPYKQAEYGKMIAFNKSKGDLFMILDCDMELVGPKWFTKMIKPFENRKVVGSFSRFLATDLDLPIDKYITLDPLQRDPLFIFLTPSIESCTVSEGLEYDLLAYTNKAMLPAGFCLFKKTDLLKIIQNKAKYMELDVIALFVKNKFNYFAYVHNVGLHHPFLENLTQLKYKRERNLKTMYFDQPDERIWTWIDWNSPQEIIKIIYWVFYVYLIVPSLFVGIKKSFKYKTILGMYELPFNLITTTAIINTFLEYTAKKLFKRIPHYN